MKKPALSLRLLALGLLGIILLSLSCSEDKVTSPDRSKPFKGLVAYWSLDEVSGSTVADGSGHGLYGIATGTTIVDGVVGKARAFNGVTDGIQVSNNDLLNITNEITLMLWARLDPSDAEGILLMKRLQNDSACEINYDIKYGFTPGHNFLAFQFGSGCTTGSNYIVTDVPGLSDGGWHHLAISFQFGSPASATWIIDGVEQPGTWTHWNGSPGGGTEIPPINSYPLTIGYQLSSSPALTKGTLDQIRIYNKALSKSEISAIYTQEKPNPIAQGLVAYWSLDEVSGSTVADGSGHGLYGIATGTTIVDGVVGKARAFNGVTDGIQVSNNDLLNITNEITLMLWARLDPSDAEGILLMKRLQNDSACEINYDIKYGFTPGHNFLAFQFGSGCTTGSNYIVTDVPGLSDGGWHHLAISFQFGSPASATWIIDGVEQPGTWTHWNGSPGGGTEIPPINSYPLTIGYQLSSSPALTKGTLDQIRIYNKALSKSEISAIYTQEKPNPIAQGLVAANANCIHLVSLTATGAAASSPAIGERAFMRHAIQDA
jgi:hypothetical protein